MLVKDADSKVVSRREDEMIGERSEGDNVSSVETT
jgi:hypothetical protein